MRWLVLVVMLTFAGCVAKAKAGTPEAAYTTFVSALQRGDAKTAWSLLTPATRDVVTAKSKAISQASQGLVRDEPEVLLFQAGRVGALGDVKPVSVDGDRAVLKVSSVGGERDVKLVKDSGRWLIDLSDQLK